MNKLVKASLPVCVALAAAQFTGVAAAADKITPGHVAFHLVGRNQVTAVTSPTSGASIAFGYLTFINGVSGSLFSKPDTISEGTAYFTFMTDSVPFTTIDNGNTKIRFRPGGTKFTVRYDPNPSASFDKMDSFAMGQVIATFEITDTLTTRVDNVAIDVESGSLVSTDDFTFGDKTYNFKKLLPHGFTATLTGPATNVPTTSQTLIQFAFSGTGVALGNPKRPGND